MRLCHECSAEVVRTGWWIVAVLLILVIVVVVSAGSYLLEDMTIDANHADAAEENARVQGHPILRKFRNLLVKSLPLSAFRIVVVVFEIITQVYIYMLWNALGLRYLCPRMDS